MPPPPHHTRTKSQSQNSKVDYFPLSSCPKPQNPDTQPMAFLYRKLFCKILLVFCIFSASLGLAAMRPLEGEQWVVLQSLQRGPTTPSGPNPCSYIPGRGSGVCRLNAMNAAGNVLHVPSAAFPSAVVEFGVASLENKSNDRDHKSS